MARFPHFSIPAPRHAPSLFFWPHLVQRFSARTCKASVRRELREALQRLVSSPDSFENATSGEGDLDALTLALEFGPASRVDAALRAGASVDSEVGLGTYL